MIPKRSDLLWQNSQGIILQGENCLLMFLAGQNSLFRITTGDQDPDFFKAKPHLLEQLLQAATGKLPENNGTALTQFWEQPRTDVSAVNLNLTDKCNLNCVYCYAQGGDYDRIAEEMGADTARDGLNNALRLADPELPWRIEFFGGEPLLNVPTIENVLNWQQENSKWREHRTFNRVSTNLTVLDEKRIDLLRRGNMILSISIDGPALVQDDQRPFKDGRASFSTIFENIRKLREAMPQNIFVARMTVFNHDSILLDSARELLSSGFFDYLSIYPAAKSSDTDGSRGHNYFSETFRDQFLLIASEYATLMQEHSPSATGSRFKGCLEVNRYLQCMLQQRLVVNHCRAGAGYFTLSPDRSVHPCHRLVGDKSWDLGFFDWDLPDSKQITTKKLRPWHTHVDERQGCRQCPIRYICGGGCKQQSLIATGDLLGGDPGICAFSSLLFEAALKVSKQLSAPHVAARLKNSFDELENLFVLCGQRAIPLPRSDEMDNHISLEAGGKIWSADRVTL